MSLDYQDSAPLTDGTQRAKFLSARKNDVPFALIQNLLGFESHKIITREHGVTHGRVPITRREVHSRVELISVNVD